MEKNNDLIFSLLIDGKGKGKTYNWQEIQSWNPKKGLLWLHFSLPEDIEENWIRDRSEISKVIMDALLDNGDRPRLIKDRNNLFLSLRAINFNIGASNDDMVFLHIYISNNMIITIRHKKVAAIDVIKESLEEGSGPKNSYEFLVEILEKISNKIGTIVHEIDDEIDEIEELVIEKADIKLRSNLSNLRRQTINIRRFLSPQREVLNSLVNTEMPWFKGNEIYKIKTLSEKYMRYLDEVESARDRAIITHEEINSIYREQLNQTMYVLSIVAAIFLPLTFFTGLLGINVGGIPGSNNSTAFSVVCVSLLIVGIIELIIFKLKKWI